MLRSKLNCDSNSIIKVLNALCPPRESLNKTKKPKSLGYEGCESKTLIQRQKNAIGAIQAAKPSSLATSSYVGLTVAGASLVLPFQPCFLLR